MTTTVDFTPGTDSSHVGSAAHRPAAADGAAHFPGGQGPFDAQNGDAVGEHNPPAPATLVSSPIGDAPVLAPHTDLPDGQNRREAQDPSAVGDQTPPAPANSAAASIVRPLVRESINLPDGQGAHEAHLSFAVGDLKQPAPANVQATPTLAALVLAPNPWTGHNGPVLALLADALDDLERTRIANENRLRQLTRDEVDADGEERGFGLTLDQPQAAALAAMVEALGALEHQATLNLQRTLRKHPLGPWVKRTVGVGEKQGARLIAAIGDPYWNTLHDRPRLVSELWAYCGLHVHPAAQHLSDTQKVPGGGGKQGDPGHATRGTQTEAAGVAPTRARGQKANWSATAKMRAYLVAESCIKQARSPYRAVYDDGRVKYADAIHQVDCRRCGPSGKPAAIGTPLSAGHQHARAMRLAMKEILRDLWLESKRLHESA